MPRPASSPPPSDGWPLWLVMVPEGRTFNVRARDRSEARARAKQVLGIPRRRRLPRGVGLRRA